MRLASFAIGLSLLACTGLGATEGTNPGECDDGADNDSDGTFDCDDSDCADAPDCDTPSMDTASSADADTDADSDADADPIFDASWSGDGLSLSIDGGSGTYSLGMAETGSPEGWYGEDCDGGMMDYDLCHDKVSKSGISLTSVTKMGDVEPNVTTLFAKQYESQITYFIAANDDSGCWVWGDDTSYYSKYDCTEL